jgi:hypothetical protein
LVNPSNEQIHGAPQIKQIQNLLSRSHTVFGEASYQPCGQMKIQRLYYLHENQINAFVLQ